MNKKILKKSPEELQQYMQFKRKGFFIQNKKGKGSYNRKKKYRNDFSNLDSTN